MSSRPAGPDWRWMDRALSLAERGRYTVSPNPMVGAVVVRRGRSVGEGFHRRAGEAHAEVEALSRAGERARGADLYVSLEPCTHFGRTPPCVDAILESGVSRVFAAAADPDPRVRGRGFAALTRAGLVVARADRVREERARTQNEKFRVWAARGRPFVLAKWASSLDGKTAASDGRSRWITGLPARRRSLLYREEYDAVLVGARTVIADDPLLTRRLAKSRGRPHWRIVLDGRLRVSEDARVFARPDGAVLVTAASPDHPKARRLSARGVDVWSIRGSFRGRVSIPRLLDRLASRGVSSLMVEGGADTLWGFFEAGCVDRVAAFLAPRVLGGRDAVAAVTGQGFPLARGIGLENLEVERLGRDLLVTARVATSRGGRRAKPGARTATPAARR